MDTIVKQTIKKTINENTNENTYKTYWNQYKTNKNKQQNKTNIKHMYQLLKHNLKPLRTDKANKKQVKINQNTN